MCRARSTSPAALPRHIFFLLLLHRGLRAGLGIPATSASKGGHGVPSLLSCVLLPRYPHFLSPRSCVSCPAIPISCLLQDLPRAEPQPFDFQYSMSHTAPGVLLHEPRTHTQCTHCTHSAHTDALVWSGQTHTVCTHTVHTQTRRTHAQLIRTQGAHRTTTRADLACTHTRCTHTRTACTRTAYTRSAQTQSPQRSQHTPPVQTTHAACSCRPRVRSPAPHTHPLHAQAR